MYRWGIVTGIQGIRRILVETRGVTAHAGTTPHAMRKDAMDAAARIMASIRELAADKDDVLRLTFGKIDAFPNSPGTVADRVCLTVDLRHPQKKVMDEVEALIRSVAVDKARPCGASVQVDLKR